LGVYLYPLPLDKALQAKITAMERTFSSTSTLQSTVPDSTTELGVEVHSAVVIHADGVEVVYLGTHGGIPPWIWEGL